jgi:hypothetical protein
VSQMHETSTGKSDSKRTFGKSTCSKGDIKLDYKPTDYETPRRPAKTAGCRF